MSDAADVWSAAGIWARATAARDETGRVRPPGETIGGIEERLSTPGAVMEVASQGGVDVGFLVAVIEGDGLELVYLATEPTAWGRGVAAALLERVDALARTHGVDDMTLWVIDDNHRALAAYERAGWTSTSVVRPHETPGRRERLVRRRAR